ncbi:MAG: hypothetical protein C4B59_08870 [Candidatus Methanogaster sp.]|uniref:Uncharacterized protein n=1 Tax=Candidatus Methanogaster sp. TaxID=3386292 RepID=A0AC61L265_9EURY|nr:MAG: hypothetical protein C4B59_08870 [ANME-2 cluster archaeon]
MSNKRVLILHSFKDMGYEPRLQQIVNNPNLDEISFRHCCVVDRDRTSARILKMNRLKDDGKFKEANELMKEVVKEEVGPLLNEQIIEFNPDVVIIHGGSVFNAVPGACITMICDLMKKHPELPFALEGKVKWLRRVEKTDYPSWKKMEVINNIHWVSAYRKIK